MDITPILHPLIPTLPPRNLVKWFNFIFGNPWLKVLPPLVQFQMKIYMAVWEVADWNFSFEANGD